MVSDPTIDGLAQHAYSHGVEPIDWAVQVTEGLIEAYHNVMAAREDDPGAYPGYVIELTDVATARRIVGELLDAGWTPPTITPATHKEASPMAIRTRLQLLRGCLALVAVGVAGLVVLDAITGNWLHAVVLVVTAAAAGTWARRELIEIWHGDTEEIR